MKYFPKFQYSVFAGTDKKRQFVVRSDDVDSFIAGMENVDKLVAALDKLADPIERAVSGGGQLKTNEGVCEKCGAVTIFKSGVSQSTKKPYSGQFCQSEECKHVKWGSS